MLEFDAPPRTHINPAKIVLVNSTNEKVYCTSIYDTTTSGFIRFFFQINSADFTVFERLVSDSTGYYLLNEEEIQLSNGTLDAGGLQLLTTNRIRKISEDSWQRYILNEYSSQSLFPHEFNVGTRLGIEDTTKTTYFLELSQSGNWVNSDQTSIFWGLKGRWSTEKNDKFNFVQFYPLTLLYNQTSWRISVSTGLETGNQGFGKQGRGTLKGEAQFRLPFNPVDFTLGNPRWRINPVVNLSLQGNLGWANVALPDSIKRSADITCKIRYDIPVGKNYYLQANAMGNYSTITKEIQYQYDFSLGYIVDGTIRIIAQYKQGYQEVTYQFDKQLLLGFALDILNESAVK